MISSKLEEIFRKLFVVTRRSRHEFVSTEHLLLALLYDEEAVEVLRACAADIDDLRVSLIHFIENNTPQLVGADPVESVPTPGFRRILECANMHVQSTGNRTKEVTGVNVFVAIFRDEDSYAVRCLTSHGVTRLDVVNFIAHGIRKG
jgi:ATP-dependent Clp protease ATP-binding subunit ClpA